MMPSSDEDCVRARSTTMGEAGGGSVARHVVVRREGPRTFVVLHGYAGDAVQTRDIFQDWVQVIDDSSFLFLEGVTPCRGVGGFAWLPLTSDRSTLADHLQVLAPLVERYIADAMADERLGREVLLVGHSQGAMLVLEMVARAVISVKGAISISGMHPLPPRMRATDARAPVDRPDVVFVHENADPMIPLHRARESERAFSELGLRTRMAVVDGGRHALSRAYANQVLSITYGSLQ